MTIYKARIIFICTAISCLSICACSEIEEQTPESSAEKVSIDLLKGIRFSMATVEEKSPKTIIGTPDSLNLKFWSEDEWRQIELISKEHLPIIQAQIDSIKNIHSGFSSNVNGSILGFDKMFVRNLIPKPILSEISSEDLQKSFSEAHFGSLSFSDEQLIENGKYIDLHHFIFYGIEQDSKYETLGYNGFNSHHLVYNFLPELKAFMESNNLLFVDWFEPKWYGSDSIENFFLFEE